VTYLAVCLKIVKVCPPYVWLPLKNLSFVVPILVLQLRLIFNRNENLSYILLKNKWHCNLYLEFIALSCSSENLFVKFP